MYSPTNSTWKCMPRFLGLVGRLFLLAIMTFVISGCRYYYYPYDEFIGLQPGINMESNQTINIGDGTVSNDTVSNCSLKVIVEGQGSVTPSNGVFALNQLVTLTATASSGWSFCHWSGDCSGNVNPIKVEMNTNKVVIAVFTQNQGCNPPPLDDPKLTVVNGTGSGDYLTGESVKISANIPAGIRFNRWEGDVDTLSNDIYSPNNTIRVDREMTITATFFSRPDNASISFTSIPAVGDVFDPLEGQVTGVDFWQYAVVVYIKVGDGWRIKPNKNQPLTKLASDKSWCCEIVNEANDPTATQIAAFLVPTYYNPPLLSSENTIPQSVYDVSAASLLANR